MAAFICATFAQLFQILIVSSSRQPLGIVEPVGLVDRGGHPADGKRNSRCLHGKLETAGRRQNPQKAKANRRPTRDKQTQLCHFLEGLFTYKLSVRILNPKIFKISNPLIFLGFFGFFKKNSIVFGFFGFFQKKFLFFRIFQKKNSIFSDFSKKNRFFRIFRNLFWGCARIFFSKQPLAFSFFLFFRFSACVC